MPKLIEVAFVVPAVDVDTGNVIPWSPLTPCWTADTPADTPTDPAFSFVLLF